MSDKFFVDTNILMYATTRQQGQNTNEQRLLSKNCGATDLAC